MNIELIRAMVAPDGMDRFYYTYCVRGKEPVVIVTTRKKFSILRFCLRNIISSIFKPVLFGLDPEYGRHIAYVDGGNFADMPKIDTETMKRIVGRYNEGEVAASSSPDSLLSFCVVMGGVDPLCPYFWSFMKDLGRKYLAVMLVSEKEDFMFYIRKEMAKHLILEQEARLDTLRSIIGLEGQKDATPAGEPLSKLSGDTAASGA